jgi:hypothetical protein
MAGKMECLIFLNFRRRKELTLNLEYNADSPSASCDRYDNLLLVPNGETGSARECLIPREIKNQGNRTYIRSTIKREAEAMARYPKN